MTLFSCFDVRVSFSYSILTLDQHARRASLFVLFLTSSVLVLLAVVVGFLWVKRHEDKNMLWPLNERKPIGSIMQAQRRLTAPNIVSTDEGEQLT